MPNLHYQALIFMSIFDQCMNLMLASVYGRRGLLFDCLVLEKQHMCALIGMHRFAGQGPGHHQPVCGSITYRSYLRAPQAAPTVPATPH